MTSTSDKLRLARLLLDEIDMQLATGGTGVSGGGVSGGGVSGGGVVAPPVAPPPVPTAPPDRRPSQPPPMVAKSLAAATPALSPFPPSFVVTPPPRILTTGPPTISVPPALSSSLFVPKRPANPLLVAAVTAPPSRGLLSKWGITMTKAPKVITGKPAATSKPAAAKPATAKPASVKPASGIVAPPPGQPALPTPPPPGPPPAPAVPWVDLPVTDLAKKGGGAWNVKGRVNWKLSSVQTFQGQPCLRMFFKKGSGTGSKQATGGVSFDTVPRGLPGDAATLSFDLFPEPGIDWSRGGKFGGLGIGHGAASGYDHSTTGASARLMWQENGGLIAYLYTASGLPQVDPKLKADGHGIGYFHKELAGSIRAGQWNTLSIGVKINTFTNGRPNPDGRVSVSINGKTMTKDDIRWSARPDLNITSIIWSPFFGGSWVAPKDTVMYARNFKLAPAFLA